MPDPRILDYLARFGDYYAPSALRERLLDAGYPPADIEAAFDEWRAARAARASRGRFGGRAGEPAPAGDVPSWVAFLGYLSAIVVVWTVLPGVAPALFVPLVLLVVGAAFLLWVTTPLHHRRGLGAGLGWGLVLVPIAPLVVLLVVAGLCVVGGAWQVRG